MEFVRRVALSPTHSCLSCDVKRNSCAPTALGILTTRQKYAHVRCGCYVPLSARGNLVSDAYLRLSRLHPSVPPSRRLSLSLFVSLSLIFSVTHPLAHFFYHFCSMRASEQASKYEGKRTLQLLSWLLFCCVVCAYNFHRSEETFSTSSFPCC